MGFICEACQEAVKQPQNQIIKSIRNVTYHIPQKNIDKNDNGDHIFNGWEIESIINVCNKCKNKLNVEMLGHTTQYILKDLPVHGDKDVTDIPQNNKRRNIKSKSSRENKLDYEEIEFNSDKFEF